MSTLGDFSEIKAAPLYPAAFAVAAVCFFGCALSRFREAQARQRAA